MNAEAQDAQEAKLLLPQYRCHKIVGAVKITSIGRLVAGVDDDGEPIRDGAMLRSDEAPSIYVDEAYMKQHKPQVGDYFVLYKGGYKSRSPDEAFEGGYTKIGDDGPDTAVAPLNALGELILEINRANGWDVCVPSDWSDFYKVCTMQALITTETSEAVEAVRKRDFENFKEEMADTLIRVLDCSVGLGIDMDAEVAKKLAQNKTRGYKHGGKAV